MGRPQRLVASTVLLALGARAQFTYQGCVALDASTAASTVDLYPQSPTMCSNYCSGLGYSYMAINSQFCNCFATAPYISKSYTDSNHASCSFNCDSPYTSQYCGGIDVTSLTFLYSYYTAPGVSSVSGTSRTTPTPSSTTTRPAPSGGSPPPSVVPSSIPSGSITFPPSGSAAPPPATATAAAPAAVTTVPVVPAQPFGISVARFLQNIGDQVILYTPTFDWLKYDRNSTSFYGIVPADQPTGIIHINVTAGQQTLGIGKRAVYYFDVDLLVLPPGSVTSSGPPVPFPTFGPGPQVPSGGLSYTNIVYEPCTTTFRRCPVCDEESSVYQKSVGTTCIPAKYFTTPCEVTTTRMGKHGKPTAEVITTNSVMPYNPAESTPYVTTQMEETTEVVKTMLVAVTKTVQVSNEKGTEAPAAAPQGGATEATEAPKAGAGSGAGSGAQAGAAAPAATPATAANGMGKGAAQATGPYVVTAGATSFGADMLTEAFILLSGIAFGAVLLL